MFESGVYTHHIPSLFNVSVFCSGRVVLIHITFLFFLMSQCSVLVITGLMCYTDLRA